MLGATRHPQVGDHLPAQRKNPCAASKPTCTRYGVGHYHYNVCSWSTSDCGPSQRIAAPSDPSYRHPRTSTDCDYHLVPDRFQTARSTYALPARVLCDCATVRLLTIANCSLRRLRPQPRVLIPHRPICCPCHRRRRVSQETPLTPCRRTHWRVGSGCDRCSRRIRVLALSLCV